jgi:hypothetical protein
MNTVLKKQNLIFLIFVALLICSCDERDDFASQNFPVEGFVPVYYDSSRLIEDISSSPPRALVDEGNVVTKDSFVFITERLSGVHVLKRTDPQDDPRQFNFINIPFVQLIDLRGNTLYAQMGKGLIQIDITDIENPRYSGFMTQRMEDVPNLPIQSLNQSINSSRRAFFECLEENGKWIVGWEIRNLTEPRCFIDI